jgi:hypothetical protein
MAVIGTEFGSGGAGLNPNGSTGTPTLAAILRDIADDLGDRTGILSADATDLASAITLVNEIKTALNLTVRTTKA